MKILTLVLSIIFLACDPVRAEDLFQNVSLASVKNYTLNHVKMSPTGHVKLGGVPFDLPKSKRAVVTEGIRQPGPTVVDIPTNVPHATTAYILLSGLYVLPEFKDKRVGEIIFEFGPDEKVTIPIVAWKTIRETWAYDDDIQLPDSEGNPKLINVYAESQNRGKPATAFLDMLVVDLGKHQFGATLTKIIVRDTSKETVDNIAPALLISGITIKHE